MQCFQDTDIQEESLISLLIWFSYVEQTGLNSKPHHTGFFFFFFIPKHVLIEEKKKNVWSQLCTRMEGLDNGGTGFCHSTKDACFRRTNLTWNSKLVETQKITNETWLEFSGWTMSNLTRLLAINFIFIYKNSNVVNIF